MSATFVDFAVLSALKFFFGWPTFQANLVSYTCGMLDSYLLNRYWVFQGASADRSFKQLLRFISINIVGLILNMVLVLLLEIPFGMILPNPAYAYIPAKIGATMLVFLWNFFANRCWTFNEALKLKPLPQPVEAEAYEQTAA